MPRVFFPLTSMRWSPLPVTPVSGSLAEEMPEVM